MKTSPFFLPVAALALALVAFVGSGAQAQWSLISDFESATVGALDGQVGWSTIAGTPAPGGNTTAEYNVAADPANPANQALQATGQSGGSGGTASANAYIPLGGSSIADGTTGTLFWRTRNGDLGDLVVGGIDVAIPESWGSYEGYMVQGNAGGVNEFKVRDGGGFSNLGNWNPDEWYNVWIVLDHTADTTSLYTSQGSDAATLLGTGAFRTGNEPNDTLGAINIRLGAAQDTNGATGYVDDFYADNTGVNLTIPSGISNPALPGDVDLDGDVDIDDYLRIRDNFRKTVNDPTNGDLTGPLGVRDGFVDFYDFGEWKANAPPAALAALFGVPEPSSFAIIAALGMAGWASQRRRV